MSKILVVSHTGGVSWCLLALSDPLLISLPSCLPVPLCFRLAVCRTDDATANDDYVAARLEDQLPRCVVLLAKAVSKFCAFLARRWELATRMAGL